jgi:Fur family ferric uptake transcriptional regulator
MAVMGVTGVTGSLEQRALARFREVLRDRALKMSTVRAAIARAALGYEGHFTVEDLLRVLHANGVREAHLATIYRAVPLMVEAGLIQPAPISKADGQRYEVAFEREHHDHLVCTTCDRVIECHATALATLQREIAARYDFALDDHVLRGRCKACRRAPRSAAPRGRT